MEHARKQEDAGQLRQHAENGMNTRRRVRIQLARLRKMESSSPIGERCRRSKQKHQPSVVKSFLAMALMAAPVAVAQNCIPLSGSTQCSAFNQSSISTDSGLVAQYPFLSFVSSTQQFDQLLGQYVQSDYVRLKYQQLLGCNNVNLSNTTDLYASADSRPLCAESCAQQASSEEQMTTNNKLCGTPRPNFMDQIRADFTVCALPADSLSGGCVTGEANEPNNCGFADSLQGLCGYCASSSPNATDSCCIGSNVTSRCVGVQLPTSSLMPPLFPSSTSSSSPSASNTAAGAGGKSSKSGLSGGQIAGIVVGSIIGAALLIGLLILCCICIRRRKRGSQKGSVFNQPSPQRRGESGMVFAPRADSQAPQQGYEVLPGGRIARMSALEGNSSESPEHGGPVAGGAVAGARRHYKDTSDSDAYGDSPKSQSRAGPPVTGKRNGSLSSNSVLGGAEDPNSPTSGSGNQYSSPEGVASGQSEQLPFFKDYYSQDEIHPNDKVATLWAYQPRAGDEFELERGEMLKVVGIWDDGWATGVRINERAEDYDGKHKVQRDSGVSNGSGRRDSSPPPTGEIKAFP
ncbi:MAG: hypothetical protein M1830_005769, partial [Pleopsidium flavum]